MATVAFTVYGEAAPAGSKRGFVNRKTGGVIISDASKRSKPWKAAVTDAALVAMGHSTEYPSELNEPLVGPLAVEFAFHVRRPKGHMGSGRNAHKVKPSAPTYPAVKPDLLKLARAVEDALSGICYGDDAQIVAESLSKAYTSGQPRVDIRIVPMTAVAAASETL